MGIDERMRSSRRSVSDPLPDDGRGELTVDTGSNDFEFNLVSLELLLKSGKIYINLDPFLKV